MERLSDNAIAIINDLHTERLDYQSEYIPLIDAANRLATYEDTGLEPDTVSKLRDIILDISGNIDHLRELVRAERDGRLLPCKVGDTVYAAETAPVIPLTVDCVGVWLRGTDGEDWESLENFGKTVFLSRKEAEAALIAGIVEEKMEYVPLGRPVGDDTE